MELGKFKELIADKREHLDKLRSHPDVQIHCQILLAARQTDPHEWYICMNKLGKSRVELAACYQDISRDTAYLSCLEAINELAKEEGKMSRRLNKRIVMQRMSEGVEYPAFQLTLYGFPKRFVEKNAKKKVEQCHH